MNIIELTLGQIISIILAICYIVFILIVLGLSKDNKRY